MPKPNKAAAAGGSGGTFHHFETTDYAYAYASAPTGKRNVRRIEVSRVRVEENPDTRSGFATIHVEVGYATKHVMDDEWVGHTEPRFGSGTVTGKTAREVAEAIATQVDDAS